MAAALAAHRVDAATLAEPYVSDAKSVARALANPMDAIARTMPATTWFANGTWLQTQPARRGQSRRRPAPRRGVGQRPPERSRRDPPALHADQTRDASGR